MTAFEIKRRAAGLSQGDLADRIGVTLRTVYSWETGKAAPQPRYIPKLAKVFRIPAEDVVRLFAPQSNVHHETQSAN